MQYFIAINLLYVVSFIVRHSNVLQYIAMFVLAQYGTHRVFKFQSLFVLQSVHYYTASLLCNALLCKAYFTRNAIVPQNKQKNWDEKLVSDVILN